MNGSTLQPADRIGALRPYAPPSRERQPELILDNNEGAPNDLGLIDALNALMPDRMTRYPDQSQLEAKLADLLGIEPARIVVTNGGDDAIDRICRAILNPGDQMLTHTPGFVMIPRYAQLAGADVRTIDWLEAEFPAQRFIDSINEKTKLVALISPSNPSGQVIVVRDIQRITATAKQRGAFVLLDQAYIEFADVDPFNQLQELDNLIVVRTFSKAYGLAGARVGYAIAPVQVSTWLRTVGGPYPVSIISLALAGAALDRCVGRRAIIEQTIVNRAALTSALRLLGIDTVESQANFVLAKFEDANAVHEQLLQRGVSVRRFRQDAPIDNYLRITVPADVSQLEQLISAMQGALQSQQEAAT